MNELAQTPIPQIMFTLLGFAAFSIVVAIVGAAVVKWVNGWEWLEKKRARRVGSRADDDIKGHNGSTTLLIDALNSLAEANGKIAGVLAAIQEGQRIHEIELTRVREHVDVKTNMILERLKA